MKRVLLYIGIALAAIGCTKDADVDSLSGENALVITSNIASRVVDEQWGTNDAIGVYVYPESDTSTKNEKFTTSGDGTFTSGDPVYIPADVTSIFAYYPWVDGVSLTNYEITSSEQTDLLIASNSEVSAASSAVAMTFEHLLSKISLTITAGNGLEQSDITDTKLSIKLSGVSAEAEIDLTNKIVVNNSLGALSEVGLKTVTADNATTSSAIVIPQSINDATLYFTTDGYGTFSATIKTENTTEFKVGYEYKYAVEIARDGVTIKESNIDIWNPNTDTGTADIVDIEYKSDKKFYINSAKGLAAFSDLVYGAGSNTKGATFAGFSEDLFKTNNTTIDGVLTRDIDLKDICYEGGPNWNPIGRYYINTTYYYNGKFDGGGYTVSNLYISSSSKLALFGYIGTEGVVSNLGVTGNVIGSSSEVGGFVSWNEGYVVNCYSEVNVSGTTNVAGIAGYNTGHVVNCYNSGAIVGTTNVGGIVGQSAAGGYVGYSFSVGDISGTTRVGGVVGYNHLTTAEAPSIKGCFCLSNTPYSIGQLESVTSSGTYAGNMYEAAYFRSADFAAIMNNGSYTFNQNNPNSPVEACAWFDNSTATDYPTHNFGVVNTGLNWIYDINYNETSNIYEIYTALGLKAFAYLVNGGDIESLRDSDDPESLQTSGNDASYYAGIDNQPNIGISGKLMNDIALDSDETWTPIGKDNTTTYRYNGTFNGGGYLVSGLNVSADYAGLFGCTDSSAQIYNLGVSGSVAGSGSNNIAGGVVGNNYGTITNCYNECSVSGVNRVGGVAGWNGGTIANCFNSGAVGSGSYIGGVVGENISGTITNCYNSYSSGNVTGSSGNGDTITNCYYLASETSSATGAMSDDDMQDASFVTTLISNAYTYNAETTRTVEASAWVAVSGGTPAISFGTDPEMYYWTMDKLSTSRPSGDVWYITDAEVSDFGNLKTALQTAGNGDSTTDITVVFSNLKLLAASAFSGCDYLTSISLPSVTEIGSSAFSGCAKLTSVSLPSATKIGSSAFSGCTALTSISLPSATEIGSSAFNGCTALTSISLPSATEIGDSAFGDCSNLDTLDLGSSGSGITSIGSSAFDSNYIGSCDLTIKIASTASESILVSGNDLTYNTDTAVSFLSITVITEVTVITETD